MVCACSASAQRIITQYEVANFKPGRGVSMTKLFGQHEAGLRMIGDSAQANPNRIINVYCVVDALTFDSPTKEDALEGGTSISRYLWAVLSLKEVGVPRHMIAPPYPDCDRKIGGDKRRILLEVVEFPRAVTPEEMKRFIDSSLAVLPPPQVVAPATYLTNQFLSQVWIGGGVAFIPAEKLVPCIQGMWGNERLRFIGEAGHSLYHQDRRFSGEKLDVTYRYVMGGVAWRPIFHSQFDLIAAWQRSEVYSTHFGKYACKLEGPAFGIRLELSKHLAVAGIWTPSEEQIRGRDKVEYDNGRFYLGLTVFTTVLGGEEE